MQFSRVPVNCVFILQKDLVTLFCSDASFFGLVFLFMLNVWGVDQIKDLTLNSNGGEQKDSPLVIAFGELLIDFVPTVGGVSLAEAPAFKKAPGGAPANVAVGISRLGGSSAFVGKVNLE